MKEKLIIQKKRFKGEDGYRVFSIRIKEETVNNLFEKFEAAWIDLSIIRRTTKWADH